VTAGTVPAHLDYRQPGCPFGSSRVGTPRPPSDAHPDGRSFLVLKPGRIGSARPRPGPPGDGVAQRGLAPHRPSDGALRKLSARVVRTRFVEGRSAYTLLQIVPYNLHRHAIRTLAPRAPTAGHFPGEGPPRPRCPADGQVYALPDAETSGRRIRGSPGAWRASPTGPRSGGLDPRPAGLTPSSPATLQNQPSSVNT